MRKFAVSAAIAGLLCLFAATTAVAEPKPWSGTAGKYHEYDRFDFTVDGQPCIVVAPKTAASGRPWVWRAEFFDAFPQIDLALLKEGFHLAYMNVGNTFGCPSAMKHFDVFYKTLAEEHALSPKPVLEGLSRGGLYVFNWGAAHPDKVACILADNAVCDFKSWPGGKGKGKGSPADWAKLIQDYGFENEAAALAYDKNPIDNLKPLADAKVPLLHLVGDADDVVPYPENTAIVEERYKKLGGPIEVILKTGQGHHPHGLDDATPAVRFICKAIYGNEKGTDTASNPRTLFMQSPRIVFLGDSITASGQYVADVEAWLFALRDDMRPHIIDCGLPSETVSGLSEDGHAGGQFPRPDLAERLDRVLELTKPNLVIACYGINCGIYQPFDEGRFQKYQDGMRRLKATVEKAGAKLVLVTPPFYDDKRSPRAFSYNEVLDRYSEWLLSLRKEGWQVIDLHGPMTRAVAERRKTDPEFTFQPDGVHPNEAGHWFMAQQVLSWLGDESAASYVSPQEMLKAKGVSEAMLPLVQQRMAILRDSYIGAAGHKRPGVHAGLSVPDAETKASELADKIDGLLTKSE